VEVVATGVAGVQDHTVARSKKSVEEKHGSRGEDRPVAAVITPAANCSAQRQDMSIRSHDAVVPELERLTDAFFRAVSFEAGGRPLYAKIHELFIEPGLLIKNSGTTPEMSTVQQFIQPRQASVDSGELTRFHEAEIAQTTEVFGNVAHRFSAYIKSGTLKGVAFEARGMISTQFILTPAGWRMSAMAWDDERPGLELPKDHGLARAGAVT
jgi:hypothetical protein